MTMLRSRTTGHTSPLVAVRVLSPWRLAAAGSTCGPLWAALALATPALASLPLVLLGRLFGPLGLRRLLPGLSPLPLPRLLLSRLVLPLLVALLLILILLLLRTVLLLLILIVRIRVLISEMMRQTKFLSSASMSSSTDA